MKDITAWVIGLATGFYVVWMALYGLSRILRWWHRRHHENDDR